MSVLVDELLDADEILCAGTAAVVVSITYGSGEKVSETALEKMIHQNLVLQTLMMHG